MRCGEQTGNSLLCSTHRGPSLSLGVLDDSTRLLRKPSRMSPKQEVYRELLRSALPYIRNQESLPFWRRWRDKTVYEEVELIHNLWPSLFEPEFAEHDLWFLNVQAQSYCQKARFSPLYVPHVALIRELFALVPDSLRSQLQWHGPPNVAAAGTSGDSTRTP